jgi:hypothetical protein
MIALFRGFVFEKVLFKSFLQIAELGCNLA